MNSRPKNYARCARQVARLIARLGALLLILGPAATAQEVRPEGWAVRTDSAPTIDGRLDDAVWEKARLLGTLTEVVPIEGAKPKDPTEIRVLFDSQAIYFGIRCFDSEPDRLISTTMERDGFFDSDDRIEMVLDTFLDRRNAFFFQVNPAGSKGDALITNNGQNFNKPWDGIWICKTSIDELGWVIEMSIPYKTLNFREGFGTWGLNIDRFVGRRNERQRWASPSQDSSIFRIFQSGDLKGLEGMQQGIGIDVAPFLVGRHLDARGPNPDEGFEFEAGLDAYFKLTSNLTASLTINTDFAETEVDERQVNLTRFPLFFPERRDFFLQDAGKFGFSNLGSNLIPFFSRTIGLANGEPVPLRVGGKLTGRAGDYSIGVVGVQSDDLDALDSQNMFAARISRDIGKQSTLGAIITRGNPLGTGDNQVVGLDANYRTSAFRGDRQLIANLWGLISDSEGVRNDQSAFGAGLSYPNDLWNWSLQLFEIQENFNPAMGFVPRTGIRRYDGDFSYNPRPGNHIRQYEYEVSASFATDMQDQLQSGKIELQPFGVEWESGDELQIEFTRTEERLDGPFEITDGIDIPQDDYGYWDYRLEFESADKREVRVEASITNGDFYGGNKFQYETDLVWKPGPEFSASLGYEHSDISLVAGDFKVDVARMRLAKSFTPDLSWSNLLQWDSESETFGIYSRLRWIPAPGQEIFVVFNEVLDDPISQPGHGLDRVFEEVAFKVVYTLRF
jgi:hypothetical protein